MLGPSHTMSSSSYLHVGDSHAPFQPRLLLQAHMSSFPGCLPWTPIGPLHSACPKLVSSSSLVLAATPSQLILNLSFHALASKLFALSQALSWVQRPRQ